MDSNAPTSERELLLDMKSGSHVAFEKLYLKYAPAITSHLIYLLKSEELVEEVAQDTFMTIWENREKLDPDLSFKAYLYKIATNNTYKIFRKAAYDQKYKAYIKRALDEGYSHIESYIYKKENEELLNKLLMRMPERQREVFVLLKIEGYSYQEISERLGISHSTINTHITRANQFLKDCLASDSTYLPLIMGALLSYFGRF